MKILNNWSWFIDLKRFLIDRRTEFSILKVVYNSLAKENTSEHCQFELREPTLVLRQNSSTLAENLEPKLH